jgi:hypothetical protein
MSEKTQGKVVLAKKLVKTSITINDKGEVLDEQKGQTLQDKINEKGRRLGLSK